MILVFLYISNWGIGVSKLFWDRHKNFEDPMLSGRDIRKTKYHHLKLLRVFRQCAACLYIPQCLCVCVWVGQSVSQSVRIRQTCWCIVVRRRATSRDVNILELHISFGQSDNWSGSENCKHIMFGIIGKLLSRWTQLWMNYSCYFWYE